ncbi:MAG: SDR family NAD(P)-dependent oxidoreductase [Myxococcota bacterium]
MSVPLAIVGIGCRLPRAIDSFAAFRRALAAGESQVRAVPPDRWDAARFHHPDHRRKGTIVAVRGGFVDGVDQFDAAFFGIGPAEAARIDPQQRWALETAYRALEDAGWPLEQVAGQRIAAVFGVSARDYDAVQTTPEDRATIGPSTNTGSAASIVANRVSYTFDLRGPSFTVDTACSSSLTALHLAARAIAAGDATAALVGGVNLVLRPEPTLGFSQGGYLSPDGECRAFSDHANGYVRGEGAATVLVRPLADAVRDGDRIWAVIRGTAANQDGRSTVMTAPSVDAQVDLLRRAYAAAGVDPRAVGYVEAHGTGTPAGDPIEATAIGRVLGAGRSTPLPIGSAKTMFGHLESAAGMVGLLKLVATVHDRVLYPNLCFRAPNPDIPFDALGIRVVTAAEALPGPVVGGVNAFGFGGANAHAVVESPPDARSPERAGSPCALYFGGRTRDAARAHARALAHAPPSPERLVTRRTAFEHRVVVRAADPARLSDALLAFADGDDSAARTSRLRDPGRVGVVFVFGGQGPQWHGMARGLLDHHPGFGAAVAEVSAALARHGWLDGRPSALERELRRDAAQSRIAETRIAQPCLFAVQVGLARVLAEHGVAPVAVTGHSIGELAAAAIAGCLSLDEAARLVVARSVSQARAEGRGRMAAIDARPDELPALLRTTVGRVEVAAFNGPTAVTIAGDAAAIAEVGAEAERTGRFFRVLDVHVPFHCHRMDEVREPFLALAGEVERRAGQIPFVSTVTGAALPGAALDAEYLWRNIREPVRFTDAFGALLDAGHTVFVELGPHPILRRGAEQVARARGEAVTYIPTLARDGDDLERLDACLDALWLAGARAWPSTGGPAALPAVPLEPVAHWNESEPARLRRLGRDRPDHPHLTAIELGPRSGVVRAVARLDPGAEPYLADHEVQGGLVFPGAGQLELCAAVAAAAGAGAVADVSFVRPIEVDPRGTEVRLDAAGPEGDFVLTTGDGAVCTRGRWSRDPWPERAIDVTPRGRAVDPARLFDDARSAGLALGPTFRGITGFWVDGSVVTSRIEAPSELGVDPTRFALHPALLDAAVQTAALGILSQAASGGRAVGLYLPAGVGRFRLARRHRGGVLWCRAVAAAAGPDEVRADLVVVEADGAEVARLDGLRLRRVRGTELGPRLRAAHAYALALEPSEVPPPPPRDGERWAILGSAPALARALADAGASVVPPGTPGLDGLIDVTCADRARPRSERLAELVAALGAGPRRVRVVVPTDDPEAGAWAGLARVAMSEAHGAAVAVVAASELAPGALAQVVLAELPAGSEWSVTRSGTSRVALRRVEPLHRSPEVVALDRTDVVAVVGSPGQVSSVGWVTARAPAPGPGEVVVDVAAAGLNFKDVVVAAGWLPDRAWDGGLTGTELGLDFAGVVRAAGPGAPFAPGDPVLGLARHTLGSFVVADSRLVVARPPELSVEQAAAIPTVGLTAALALEELARVQPGEWVLVHAGAGGVGLVAIGAARALGARVIASAGSDERRARLLALGVDAVVDSRSPRFRDEALAITGGRGVDVVLNSLAGDLLVQGLRCLAPFGRFVEIGKTDLYDNALIGLEPFAENRALFGLDVNRWANLRRDRTGVWLAEVVRRFTSGRWAAPPTLAVPFDRAGEALSALAHGRHPGKVVVTRSATVPASPPSRFEARGTVLVTGGTSGFGLAVARWAAERGADRVVLASRSGQVADRAALAEIPAEVEVVSLDVRDPAAVGALVERLRPALAGVVHAAMVLDDAPLAAHDAARFDRVLGPKADGAWNLHHATLGLPLDWFVVVSSIAAAIGTPGQAAYAAANGFLDALASHRRARGLPATAIAFGALGDVGIVARASDEDRRKILAHGVGELRIGEALELLEGALLEHTPHRVAAVVDWERIVGRVGGRFAHLVNAAPPVTEGTAADELRAVPLPERASAVAAHLAPWVARLVGADQVDLDTPLSRVGLDSLVATELAGKIGAELGVSVPLVRLLRGPTLRELGAELAPQLAPRAGAAGHTWVRRGGGHPRPRARLVCFLPLGGEPSAFDEWQAEVPPGVEVCTVELPLDAGSIEEVRQRLVDELTPLCDLPLGLYGHSVGGWVALEVAPRLPVAPRFVALGAVPTAERLASIVPTEAEPLDDDRVLQALAALEVPAGALAVPELRARLMAATRRDLRLGASGWSASGAAYAGDVVVIRGATDRLDTLGVAELAALGLNCVASHEVSSGHLFHQDPSVRRQLTAWVARPLLSEVGT